MMKGKARKGANTAEIALAGQIASGRWAAVTGSGIGRGIAARRGRGAGRESAFLRNGPSSRRMGMIVTASAHVGMMMLGLLSTDCCCMQMLPKNVGETRSRR